jgi:hypothetical protein
MQREEFDRLLAGYATNQLSADETARLMEAALADQSLFDALADEDALRETLADPLLKAELLRALAPVEKHSFWNWLRKPQIWALAGTAAVAVIAVVFFIQPKTEQRKPAEIAQAPAPKFAPATQAARVDAIRDQTAQPKKDVEPQREAKAEQLAAASEAPAPPAPAMSAKPKVSGTARPALQYTILRRNNQGEFIETSPGALLDKGDAIRLEVISAGRGYISLTESGTNRPIYYGFAEPGVKYEIPSAGAVTLDSAGMEKRLLLSFMTGVGNAATQSPGAQSLVEQDAGPASQATIELVLRTR